MGGKQPAANGEKAAKFGLLRIAGALGDGPASGVPSRKSARGGSDPDHLAFSLLRRGALIEAADVVAGVPKADRSLRLAVTGIEVSVGLGASDIDEIERLRDLAEGDDELQARIAACLADHFILRGDPVAATIAVQALVSMPEDPMLAAELLWARGRLRRAVAVCALFVPGDRPAGAYTLLDLALIDLGRAGFDAERALSAAEVPFVWTLVSYDDVDKAQAAVSESLARLRVLGSSHVELVLSFQAYLHGIAGDMAAAHACADEAERLSEGRVSHPLGRALVAYLRVVSRLLGEGPTPSVLAAIDAHLTLVRTLAMPAISGQFIGIAGLLADLGEIELARSWAAHAGAGELSTPQTASDLVGLVARIDLLERGDDAAVAAVDADLTRTRDLGLEREAALRALRAARAAVRTGRHDVAARFHAEGLRGLPPPARRTLWEHLLARPLPMPSETKPVLRVLSPELGVEAGGALHLVQSSTARLAAVLVADGGSATSDRLVDVLWPDVDLTTGRARLRVALHRLRRALGDDGPDLVVRRGDVVALSPDIEVDAVEFERLAAGGLGERHAALALYRADVCAVQLAYDDAVAPLRRRLAATWRALAAEALAAPDLPQHLVHRIAEVGASGASLDPEVAHLLALAEERVGRPGA